MIKPSDISVTVEPADHYPSQRIRAGLRMTTERFTASDGSVEVEREQERCRAEIWHELYGDIEREIAAVERAVYPLLYMGGYERTDAAFKKLRALLKFNAEAIA